MSWDGMERGKSRQSEPSDAADSNAGKEATGDKNYNCQLDNVPTSNQDNNHYLSSAPVPPLPGPGNTPPGSGAGTGAAEQEGQARPPRQIGRPKGAKNKTGLSPKRLAQLRRAGKAGLAKAIQNDPLHQRKAGKARAARGDMGEIAKKGHHAAMAAHPDLPERAGKASAQAQRKRRQQAEGKADHDQGQEPGDQTGQQSGPGEQKGAPEAVDVEGEKQDER